MLFSKSSDEDRETRSDSSTSSKSSSKLDLKKFFKPQYFKKHTNSHHAQTLDDILLNKFNSKLGPLLGTGAGGSVRLLDSFDTNSQVLAIKQFRKRQSTEQMKEYVKKCEIEFATGLNLHHENIIETKDFFHLHDDYYEVMEYCDYDFFAIVMKSNLKRFEINCYFKQICSGVKYLHEYGIAHRDLKLDNCVVNSNGILKIVDFGSCLKFKEPNDDPSLSYSYLNEVVGSGPYMAPEMFENEDNKYDPRLLDIWSIAIIYCCMTIKKFPWKTPQDTDQSFYLFSKPDEKPHDYLKAAQLHAELLNQRRQNQLNSSLANLSINEKTNDDPNNNVITKVITDNKENNILDAPIESGIPIATENRIPNEDKLKQDKIEKNNQLIKKLEHKSHNPENQDQQPTTQTSTHSSDPSVNHHHHHHHQQQNTKNYSSSKIQGPYRLMRLLPHSARPIISGMLSIEPSKRSTFDQIFKDDWFLQIEQCTKTHKSEKHQHQFVDKDMAHMVDYKE